MPYNLEPSDNLRSILQHPSSDWKEDEEFIKICRRLFYQQVCPNLWAPCLPD